MRMGVAGWLLWLLGGVLGGYPFGAGAQAPMPYEKLFRIDIPKDLPAHPRVFCTQADIDRVKSDLARGDFYTKQCVDAALSMAKNIAAQAAPFSGKTIRPGNAADAARLAEAYILTGNEQYGRLAREYLLWMAGLYPSIPTNKGYGRIADKALTEGPVAVNCSMAYDLVYNAPFMTAADRKKIENDLLRTMAWECGHKCGHRNSSNWRTWALTIIASCGFAIGDRALIEEAINGVYDSTRSAYLYGVVQQIAHSFFSDGIHWERSVGYTYYTLQAMEYILVAAKNSGIDVWHAPIPGILGPFVGSAPHEEYGPDGLRSIRYALDALFYLPFQNGQYAAINDSGRARLHNAPIFASAWAEYHDPKYAWLMRETMDSSERPAGWQVWAPQGKPTWVVERKDVHGGGGAVRMTTDKAGRIALVQNVSVAKDQPTVVTGWVKAIRMNGGSAHIRVNPEGSKDSVFSQKVTKAGGWTQVRAEMPAGPSSLRLHVFLEGGEGDVIWDDIEVHSGGGASNLAANGGFDALSNDGRNVSFWDMIHTPPDVPEGRYTLAEDAKIGLTGRHENGCTLFPVGGFAVLRSSPTDVDATSFLLSFGPYGSGHDHPDRLHFSLYGFDAIRMPDAGSWGYENPMHVTWANQTVAHNTLTVDETAQLPQGKSTSIWAAESGAMRVFGKLRLFHAGKDLKVVRATCDTAYPGVTMDRTLCLVGDYVLDVFRAESNAEHTYDLSFHGLGALQPQEPLAGATPRTFTATGYAHLRDARVAPAPAKSFVADWGQEKGVNVRFVHAAPEGAGGEIILAGDPETPKSSEGEHSCVIVRRRGRATTYVTVLEPWKGKAGVEALDVARAGDGLRVTVRGGAGSDVFVLPDGVGGEVSLARQGAGGKVAGGETARP